MSFDAGVDVSTGTPAAIACSFAVTLLPAISSTCSRRADEGDAGLRRPPAASSGFSERKP